MSTKVAPKVTPMMKQFLAIKDEHKEYMLFYRMGDFYELFFDDAVKAAEILDIALTKRGKHNGDDIPMAGVPAHSYEPYLERLIRAGQKVAICEQTETPEEAKKRAGYKAVVNREVVRIITSGTITEETLLSNKQSNYLASISEYRGAYGIALVDISTGEFFTSLVSQDTLLSELAKFSISEAIFPQTLFENNELYSFVKQNYQHFSPHPLHMFDPQKGEERIKEAYNIAVIDSLGDFSAVEIGAVGALLEYINITQKGKMPRLDIPRKIQTAHFMAIDASTRRNLELTRTMRGEYKGSLLSVINKTVTATGSRLFVKYLSAPLTDHIVINQRLNMVEFFINEEIIRDNSRKALKHMTDMERAISRISIGRGSPKDMQFVRIGLEVSAKLTQILQEDNGLSSTDGIKSKIKSLGNHMNLINLLRSALSEELPPTAKNGGFIKDGYSKELDEFRMLSQEGENLIQELRAKYAKETEINNLKIKYNNMLGYFIEVNKIQAEKLGEDFIHRQTVANAMRFKTTELEDLQQKIENSSEKALHLEFKYFVSLTRQIIEKAEDIIETARAIAVIDVMSALAFLAVENDYCRPKVDDSYAFNIEDGRHPVVEVMTEEFISNTCNLKKNVWLLTGPNMAGKSTFLRQNALIAIMAGMGSYVPAKSAHIGVVDKVFSRVGASDDLASGQSTFMVEMIETATILNQATERSFVILDEIGRGTATFDGLSIAWATIEHIHDVNRCRTLFATHYHELKELTQKLDGLHAVTMQVKEWKGDIVFLHHVVDGSADRSYGIHVAGLAGIPRSVIARANEILEILEGNEAPKVPNSMPLFNNSKPAKPRVSAVEEKLNDVNIDELSPKEALDLLYKMKGLL